MTRSGKKQDPESRKREEYLRGESYQLVLHNDDMHSFDFVIQSLMEICDHTAVQAEQCATLTHYKGSCQVRRGSRDELMAMKEKLTSKGLTASIEHL
jgi:ATP-dependent Clp protease adaptor protein ClpS